MNYAQLKYLGFPSNLDELLSRAKLKHSYSDEEIYFDSTIKELLLHILSWQYSCKIQFKGLNLVQDRIITKQELRKIIKALLNLSLL